MHDQQLTIDFVMVVSLLLMPKLLFNLKGINEFPTNRGSVFPLELPLILYTKKKEIPNGTNFLSSLHLNPVAFIPKDKDGRLNQLLSCSQLLSNILITTQLDTRN